MVAPTPSSGARRLLGSGRADRLGHRRTLRPEVPRAAPVRRAGRSGLLGIEHVQQLHGSFVQTAFPYQPNLRLAYEQQLETEIKSDPGSFDWLSFRGDAYLPITIDPDRMLMLGATGRMRRYDFTSSSPVPGNEDLHEFSALLGLGWFLSEDWLLQIKFMPGVYSDLDGTLNHRDWEFFGELTGVM